MRALNSLLQSRRRSQQSRSRLRPSAAATSRPRCVMLLQPSNSKSTRRPSSHSSAHARGVSENEGSDSSRSSSNVLTQGTLVVMFGAESGRIRATGRPIASSSCIGSHSSRACFRTSASSRLALPEGHRYASRFASCSCCSAQPIALQATELPMAACYRPAP